MMRFLSLLIFILCLAFLSCKKDQQKTIPPLVNTLEAEILSFDSVILCGSVNPESLTTTIEFEYGATTSYGTTIASEPANATGDSSIQVTAVITGVQVNTIYYYRIKATNKDGTSFGDQAVFVVWLGAPDESVSDINGNNYNTVKIGDQVWMAKNLRTEKYSDGTNIPNVTNGTSWNDLTTGAYSWYNNDSAIYSSIGAIYNWYTVNTGKLCPAGWHVPSESEWTSLEEFLGGGTNAAGKLKSSGTIEGSDGLWKAPNNGADNSSGFSAIPGGYRNYDGTFLGQDSTLSGFWLNTGVRFRSIINHLTDR